MNDAQKKILLKTAYDTVTAVINGKRPPVPKCEDPQLNANCGCFVTLKTHERLRGCIGQFTSNIPLIELVVEMATASAVSDSRFFSNPITPAQLNDLDVEISVLSPLKKTNDPLSLRLGVDGIYIKKGYASGCFLPQVATETGWTKEEFLGNCCSHKAGLSPDAWKDKKTEVYLFSAEVFGASFRDIKNNEE